MSKRDEEFYKLFPRPWDEGTANLSLELEGALLRICNAIHKSHEPIAHNRFVLAGMWRCNTQKANRILRALIAAGKVWIVDGRIHNKRAESELGKRNLAAVSSSPVDEQLGSTSEAVGEQLPTSDPTHARKPLKSHNRSDREEKRREEKRRKKPPLPPKGGVEGFEKSFSDFSLSYPKRFGSDPTKTARKAYEKAIANGADPTLINNGAEAYAQLMRQLGKERTDKVAMRATWLNQERWKDDYTVQPNRQGNGNGHANGHGRKSTPQQIDEYAQEHGIDQLPFDGPTIDLERTRE